MSSEVSLVRWQIILLRCLTPPSALFSIVGSLLICQKLVARWTKSRSDRSNQEMVCYERLMLGLSISDLLISMRLIVSSLVLLPYDEPSHACTAEGFLVTFGFSGPFYNAAISLFFLITICSRQKETRISWWTESTLHIIAIGFPLGSAIVGLSLRLFNPAASGLHCWAMEYPGGCKGTDCIRGAHARVYRVVVAHVPLALIWIFLIGSNAAIYLHVRRHVQKTLRYTKPEQPQLAITASVPGNYGQSKTNVPPLQPNKSPIQSVSKTRMVATQSILYVGAYFLCFIWTFILEIAAAVDPEGFHAGKYFYCSVAQYLLYPSQGIFNAFIFCRPNYMRIRASVQGRELSRLQCLKLALFTPKKKLSNRQLG
jgi:hypothetical protein